MNVLFHDHVLYKYFLKKICSNKINNYKKPNSIYITKYKKLSVNIIFKTAPAWVFFFQIFFIIYSPLAKKRSMKIKVITAVLLFTMLTGCDNLPEQAEAAVQSNDPTITAQFELSDEKIGEFLDQLDDPNTTQDVRILIICKDYPSEFKANYMSALLKLSPTAYTREKLLKDLDVALDYYIKKDNVKC